MAPVPTTLSEARSRTIVADAGVRVSPFVTAPDVAGLVAASRNLDQPLVVKLCGDGIAHKTERGLVRLRITGEDQLAVTGAELLAAARPGDGPVELLASSMVDGNRELIAGLVRDPQFGMCVMLGVGGIFAEAIQDVAFRLAPLSASDAFDLIDDLSTRRLLDSFRGEPPVNREALVETLIALSDLAERPTIRSVDLNPLVVVDGVPVAVDALVVTE